MHKVIDGKKLAQDIIEQVRQMILDESLEPQLAVVLVGNDPASHMYVRLKQKACQKAGIELSTYVISEDAPQEEILSTLQFLNDDPQIDAILIQLPLPPAFDQQKIINAMDYRKDVDGFHPHNITQYLSGKPQHILPGLAMAIWNLIASTGEENYLSKQAVIVGKSKEFTEPLKKLLHDQRIPAVIVAPHDPNLKNTCLTADILISAIGRAHAITEDMVKDGVTVIDVGINQLNGQTVGDVDYVHVANKAAFITPVPGGVGPMTVAMLLYNTWLLARYRKKSSTEK